MKFSEMKLKGAFILEIEPIKDERGFFSRTFCVDEFTNHGLDSTITQSSISYNKNKLTLRGMHLQTGSHAENKVVTCIKGKLLDVIIDLRPNSTTYCNWLRIELSEKNKRMLYIPKGFAHGFLTLENNTTVHYNISERYCPEASKGVRYNDPAFNINWEYSPKIISERDRTYADFIK